jgi:hypothetical protein
MARHERHREDLLAEATALVERAALVLPGFEHPVVIGFRPGGSASVFFGDDPVYQFNAEGMLRRAYVGGLLYKAERGRLVELSRVRTDRSVSLVRRELTDEECRAFLLVADAKLQALSSALTAGDFEMEGQVPAEADVVSRAQGWMSGLPRPLSVAPSPRVS